MAKRDKPKGETREVALKPTNRREPEGAGVKFRAETANEDERTVEMIFSTGARVRRYGLLPDGSGYGPYDEELAMEPGAVDLSRMNDGRAPILDAHFNWSMEDQLGTVVANSAKLAKGVGTCTARFRDTDKAMEVFRSVVDGTVGNVSVGYRVQAYEVTREEGQVPLFKATRWTPLEVSMVPIGADASAGVRSAADSETPCTIVYVENTDMTKKADQAADRAAEARTDQAAESASEVRTEPAKSTQDTQKETASARDEGVRAERERISGIRKAARILGDDAETFAEDLIERGVSLDAARTAIIDKAAEASEASEVRGHRIEMGVSNDDPAVMRERMAEAAASRYTGTEPSEAAREYVGLSMAGMAASLLEARGENVRRMRDSQIIERALGTTDFPILLQGTGDRMLMPSYDAMPATFQAVARRITNRDFRTKNLIRDGDFPALLPLNEHGELKEGAMTESQETVKLATVGRRLRLTRQALVNDDLGAFAELAAKAGQAARTYENETVWGVVTSNAKLSDNKALFHTDHKNLAAAGAAISASTVGAGKTAIRTQKNGDGKTLNYTPSVIAVPAALETTVEQYLANIVVPTKTGDVVPASHKQLTPVVEPLLDAASETAWYLFCDPGRLSAIVYAYLEGQEGPQMLQQDVSLLGITFDVVLDFAAAPVEYRAAYKDPGA